jgi:hypothetical protein
VFTAKNLVRRRRNQKSEYLRQRRKGRKEIKLPDLAFLASWREQIPVLASHASAGKFAQAAKTSTFSGAKFAQNVILQNAKKR